MDEEILEHEGWLTDLSASQTSKMAQAKSTSRASNGRILSMRTGAGRGLSQRIRGSSKKVRFFRLMRIISKSNRERAELRYFVEDPSRGTSKARGKTILLSASDKVTNTDSEIYLISNGKTFVLAPHFPNNEAPSRDEKFTSATRWVHAIEGSLRKLRTQSQRMGISSLGSSQKMSERSSENGKGAKRTTLKRMRHGFQSMKSVISRPSFSTQKDLNSEYFPHNANDDVFQVSDDDMTQSDDVMLNSGNLTEGDMQKYTFRDVWDKAGFRGYMKILSMNAEAETDQSRIESFIKNKIRMTMERLAAINEGKKTASEPVMKHQATTFNALKSLYDQDKKIIKTLEMGKESFQVFEKDYKAQLREFKNERERLTESNHKYVQELKKRQTAYIKAMRKVTEAKEMMAKAQEALSTVSLIDSEAGMNTRSVASNMNQRRAKLGALFTKMKGRLGNTQSMNTVSDDPQELYLELENTKRTAKDKEQNFKEFEAKTTVTMYPVLDELEDFMQRQLEYQKRALLKIVEIETGMFQAYLSQYIVPGNPRVSLGATTTVLAAVEAINPEKDLESTTQELVSFAEKMKKDGNESRVAKGSKSSKT